MESYRTTLDVPLHDSRELHDAKLPWCAQRGVATDHTTAVLLIRDCTKPNASAIGAPSPFTFTK